MKKTLLLLSTAFITAYSGKAQLVNGNMDSWRTYTSGFLPPVMLEVPNSWYSLDSSIAALAPLAGATPAKQLFKSTVVHGGTFAARLVSHDYGSGFGVLPSVLSNAKINVNPATVSYTTSGGTAITQRVTSVTAWIKYNPKSAVDSASFGVAAILEGVMGANGQDSVVGRGVMSFGAQSTYTQMTVNLVYSGTANPNRVQIGFVSSKVGGADSSELFVDDVSMISASGIRQGLFNAAVVKCYPNPTTGMLYLSSGDQATFTWEAMNTTGQVIAQKSFTQNATVQLGNIPAGIYYFRVLDKDKNLVQTGKFTRQ